VCSGLLERVKLSEKLTKEKIELLKKAGYSRNAIELYGNRVNVGIIENADVALAYTGLCGDTTQLYLKINDQNKIEDAKFQYLGCPASAVCGSIVTQIAKRQDTTGGKGDNRGRNFEGAGWFTGR